MAEPTSLKRSNRRMTRQRRVILEELAKVTSHPTADAVYEMVRKRIPSISLGTVYRNLEILSCNGYISKIEVGGCQKRFDANVVAHDHVRCTACGRVDDIPAGSFNPIEQAQGACGYDLTGYRLEFVGLCPKCRRKRGKRQIVAGG